MTSRERFLACLRQQPADRVAVGNAVSAATVSLMDATGCAFPDAHLDAGIMTGLAASSFEILGFDTIAPYFSVVQEAAAFGSPINWGRRDCMPTVAAPLYTQAKQIEIPEDLLKREPCAVVLEALRRLRRKFPDTALIGKVFGPWTLSYHLFGTDNFLMMTLDDPEQVHEIIRRLSPVPALFAQAQLEAGADAITLADHASGDIVSLRAYREFLWRAHCALSGEIHAPVILHTCGNTADRLADFARTGLACFHFDSKVPPATARQIVNQAGAGPARAGSPRHPIALMGAINNPKTLLQGTPADVAREVHECLRCEIEIIGPECAVPLNTPTRNLQAISAAVKAFSPK